MDRLEINTHLTSFIMPDQIIKANDHEIEGIKFFADLPVFTAIETMAQLSALHVRFLTQFQKHAFLLKINHCNIDDNNLLTGTFNISCKLESNGKLAYSYTVQAFLNNIIKFSGKFLIGVVDYSSDFKHDILKQHYQRVFSCLQNVSETN